MNQTSQDFLAARYYSNELTRCLDEFKVPNNIRGIWGKSGYSFRYDLDDATIATYESWASVTRGRVGDDFFDFLTEHLRDLAAKLMRFRRDTKSKVDTSFEKAKVMKLRQVRTFANDAFCVNEGRQFDFRISSGFNDKYVQPYPSIEVTGNDYYYHGGKMMRQWTADVRLSPRYLRVTDTAWRHFMNGKNKCWVYDAEELNDHALNDFGYRVHRARAFGMVPDEERPVTYQLYIVDAPQYKDSDGNILFGHGETVNQALNLLKRRVKSETLKRLSI